MTPPTISQVEQKIREFAALAPDFVYTPDETATRPSQYCKYEPDENNPCGCIVGAAARELGVILDHSTASAGIALRRAGVDDASSGISWVRTVQMRQDQGATWADAVRYADRQFNRRIAVAPIPAADFETRQDSA